MTMCVGVGPTLRDDSAVSDQREGAIREPGRDVSGDDAKRR